MEVSSRGLIWGTILAFTWREKQEKNQGRRAGRRAEIWTRGHPSTHKDC
jgi:hypothetical protein